MPQNVTNQRLDAAWRARACAAGIACGAQIYCIGAGAAVPLCLNAAWLCALPAAGLSALLSMRANRYLPLEEKKPTGRLRLCLLAGAMLVSCLFLLAAMCALAGQTLLPQARAISCAGVTLLFAVLCALPRMQGAARLGYALRFMLPALLLACAALQLPGDAASSLFPLLGRDTVSLLPGVLLCLCGAAPALMLMLPPQGVHGAPPGACFLARRVLAGGLCGAGAPLMGALMNGFEAMSQQDVWGMRLRIAGGAGHSAPAAALTLLQLGAMALGAAALLCAAEEALTRAFPRLCRLRAGLLLCAAGLMAALALLSAVGLKGAVAAVQGALLPMAALPLSGKHRKHTGEGR